MRVWVIALALLFAVAVYFVVFSDRKTQDNAETTGVSADNPFFSPKKVEMAFGNDPLQYGEKLVQEGKNADAIAVLGGIFKEDGAPERKASAMLTAGIAFTSEGDPDKNRFAREVFEQYLIMFPKDPRGDTAHYYLGAIAMDGRDPSRALAHFTTIAADFPESGFSRNAAFHSRTLAALIERQDHTIKDRALRVIGPLIPRDVAAMTTVLAYLISALGFLAYEWEKIKKKLFEEKNPAAWGAIVLTATLISVNYVREWQHAASVVDLPKVLLKR